MESGGGPGAPGRATLGAVALGALGCLLLAAPAAAGAASVLFATEQSWFEPLRPVVEIAVFFLIFLAVFRFMQGTRGEGMLKAILTVTFIGFTLLLTLARKADLPRLSLVLQSVVGTTVIAVVIVFQPELRRALMQLGLQLGENALVKLFIKSDTNPVAPVVQAAVRMAKNKVGALIAFERETGLGTYIDNGVRIDAEIGSELLETIFFPGSALHDGAVIIREQRIAAAGCLFPLTDNPRISKKLGTRHRAALGLTEETDAVTICVSEETGRISLGVGGELKHNLDAETLDTELRKLVLRGDDASEDEDEASADGGAASGHQRSS